MTPDRAPTPRELVLAVDWGCTSALWLDGRGVPLASLPLDDALRDRLRRWCADHDDHCRWDTGWSSQAAMLAFVADGEALLVDVRSALGSRVIVTPRFGSAEELATGGGQ